MSKQAYHALTLWASAVKPRGTATSSDITETLFKYTGKLDTSHTFDIAAKSGADEQSAMILNYAWGEALVPAAKAQYLSHMSSVILAFDDGIKFKDNVHMLDRTKTTHDGGEVGTAAWLPTNNMIRLPLAFTGDRWNVDNTLHCTFYTAMDMVLPIEDMVSGGVNYTLYYGDTDANGNLDVITGEFLANFGLHVQITGPDIGR